MSSQKSPFWINIANLWSYSQELIKNVSHETTFLAGATSILHYEGFFYECESTIPKSILLSTKRYIATNLIIKVLHAVKNRNLESFSNSSMQKITYGIGVESVLRCSFDKVKETYFGEKTDEMFTKITRSYSLNEDDGYKYSWIPYLETQKSVLRETGLHVTTKFVEYYADRKDMHECIHDGIGVLFNVALHKCIDSHTQKYRDDNKFFARELYDASVYNPYGQYLLIAGSKILFDSADSLEEQRCDAKKQVLRNVGSFGVNTAWRIVTPKVIEQAEKISCIQLLTNQFRRLPVSIIFIMRELSYTLATYFIIKNTVV